MRRVRRYCCRQPHLKTPGSYDVLLTTNLFGEYYFRRGRGLVSSLVPDRQFWNIDTHVPAPSITVPNTPRKARAPSVRSESSYARPCCLSIWGELIASNAVKHAMIEHLKGCSDYEPFHPGNRARHLRPALIAHPGRRLRYGQSEVRYAFISRTHSRIASLSCFPRER